MHVLGVDTATKAGSVALIEQVRGSEPSRLAEVAHEEELRHAETLLPAVDACLERAGLELGDVDGISVSIGPGSFTGLRVGLATAKGLAFGGGKWVVGVRTLQAYAHAARSEHGADQILVCLDARKGEVYDALFDRAAGGGGVVDVLEEAVQSPQDAVARLRTHLAPDPQTTLCVVGDGAARYPEELVDPLRALRELRVVPQTPDGRGFAVAELGAAHFWAHGPHDTAYLAPRYLRASEAELKLRQRRLGT